MDKKAEIQAYINNRLTIGADTLKTITVDPLTKHPLPRRSVALVVEMHIRNFERGKTEPRWIIIPGLRGVGKTTLLAQLFNNVNCKKNYKIYLSLDETNRNLGVSLSELLNTYEELLGTKFEKLDAPLYIFLDEVSYDPSWGITLKTLYDRTKNVFIVCTGSSALSIQTNPDIVRRAIFTKIYPLSYSEYRMIKDNVYPIRNLGNTIREAIFNSRTAEEVYETIKKQESNIKAYYKGVKKISFDSYLKYGTLPFALALAKENLIYPQINQTLNSILTRDIPLMNTFDKHTLDKLSQVLYTVASYDETSFKKIADTLGLNPKTVESVFIAMQKAELLIRIYPYGPHETQVRRPSKFLFASPAFRAMYFNLTGSVATYENYKGKLFEDLVGLYLYRIYAKTPEANLTYDSAKGGADFILGFNIKAFPSIIIEASLQHKGSGQVMQTMGKVNAKYGIVISSSPLRLDESKKCVTIPVHTFLLI